jgi:hypothetical protein
VADNEVVLGDEPSRLPLGIGNGAHDAGDRRSKRLEADLDLSSGLVVADVRTNQALEVDAAGVPLVVERLDDGLVVERVGQPSSSSTM